MQSFKKLYSDYNNDIYNFLFKITGYDQALAEELTQETFYQAFLSITKFKGKCHIKTWLCQIAKNIYYQQLRREKREFLTMKNISEEKSTLTMTPSPHTEVEHAELIQKALFTINSFDDKTRDVMLYRLYSDLPYAQISLLLEISEGSVKVIFYRGKLALQIRLREDYGYEI